MNRCITALTIIGILSLLVLAACGGNGTAEVESGDAESRESGGEHSSENSASSEDEGRTEERGDAQESGDAQSRESGGEHSGESSESGEHSEEGSESSEHGGTSGEGEESGTQYGLDDTYDNVRAGARLIISYDADANAFTGTVENTTSGTLTRVRVEVHLSNGIELRPTTPTDLAPGEKVEVVLEASVQPFETWSAHPEVG